ncbi:MAG: acyl-phosphate glycerol 3-phosphate acyltransferase, partial [Candidatus Neomarinimicrobiota bacterium]
MISLLVILLLSYLVGSIPTSIIAGKILKKIDIRDYGSGNAGGTNAFRVLGWKAGVFVTLLDIAKGTFSTLVISKIRIDALPFDNATLIMILAGICAILGHTYTIFAGFRGGKGVGTGAGMLIGLFPISLPFCIIVFALVLFSTGIVSISSMAAAFSLPIVLIIIDNLFSKNVDITLTIFSIIIPFFIIFTHRSNIKRLI